jgi:4-diphosphocytidyl-2-C-methyl-D-erythritol kinase
VAPADLPALAADLGSDVAFPLVGGTAVGTGRGEVLTPLPTVGSLHWVFVLADFGISSGDAYRELDRLRASSTMPRPALDADAMCAALASGDPERVASVLHNDLQPASRSLAPSLDATLAAGRAAGALAGVVSGSGPTCAFLCADAASAALVAAAFGPDRARVARGPVPGATLLDSSALNATVRD